MGSIGLSKEDFGSLLLKQNYSCAICGTRLTFHDRNHTTPATVDDDHLTNTVRGLLCHECNRGLGVFKEDPELLGKAVVYLTEIHI